MIFDETFVRTTRLAIPRPEIGPATEEARLINVALLRDDEIRLRVNAVLREAFQAAVDDKLLADNTYELAILDLGLPGLDGGEVLRRLRSTCS